jgi:hypothetical protein
MPYSRKQRAKSKKSAKPHNRRTPMKGNKPEQPRYGKPRTVQSWSTPERAYVSCLATAAYDDGKRGKQIVAAVANIVPDWKSFFEVPPSNGALINRAHNSRCSPTSKTEAPEVSKHKKSVWPMAEKDYRLGVCSLRERGRRAA